MFDAAIRRPLGRAGVRRSAAVEGFFRDAEGKQAHIHISEGRETMRDVIGRCAVILGVAFAMAGAASGAQAADKAQIARGKYLVTVSGCNDCHTPGYFLGKPDGARFLGGSDVGFAIPGLGVFVGPNLTPDKETGLGSWTAEQIAAAITKGERPDGRTLAPIMPWRAFAHLTKADTQAIVAYLRSLPPVKHAVPGPYGPDAKVGVFVMSVLPADAYNALPKPAPGAKKP
jgi:mono/diheme cytochrome c family protein